MRETLESVSSCTRFSGFLTISSFGFNRLSSKLVGMFMFFGIVSMLRSYLRLSILCQIASSRRYARIPARTHILAHICAMKQSRTKSFSTNIGTATVGTIPFPKNMPTNFELKRFKRLNPKLDIVEKPENRVHKLTDSNGTQCSMPLAFGSSPVPAHRGLV